MQEVEALALFVVPRRNRSHVLDRCQHERERGSELVAYVAEESGLGAIDFGERFDAPSLFLVGRRIADGLRDTRQKQIVESIVRRAAAEHGAKSGNHESERASPARALDGQDHRGTGRREAALERDHAWPIEPLVESPRGRVAAGDGQRR